MKGIAVLAAVAFVVSSAVCDESAEFAWALNMGADAKMTLRIVNEDGVLVPDADVEFGFWNSYYQGGFRTSIDSYLVFRTRTEVGKEGDLLSAHYGKIYGKWGFYDGMKAEAFFSIRRPTIPILKTPRPLKDRFGLNASEKSLPAGKSGSLFQISRVGILL